jgi:hypothetical protein
VGFDRVAAHHVPPDTTLVVRWDVDKIALFEPTRRFLLPLLDAPRTVPPNSAATVTGTALGPRRERFAHESGTLMSRDLREAVALFGPGAHDWAVILAGAFSQVDLLEAAAHTFHQEDWPWRRIAADRLVSPEGAALGRTADGALVLASNAARLDAVLVRRPALPEVPRVGAGSLRLVPSTTDSPVATGPLLETLGRPAEVSGDAEWASPLPVHLVLHFEGQPPADIKERIHRALELLLGDDLQRIERRAGPVSVQSAGNQDVRVTVLFDDMALERAANRVAQAVAQAFGTPVTQDLAK